MSRDTHVREIDVQKIKQWRKTGIPPENYLVLPPDGQWGWVVLFGCCISGLTAVTVTVLFGVLLNDLIELLQTNTYTISWVIAISSGCSNILGPVVTVAVHTLSCRSAILMGGMAISMGVMLSSYATDVNVLMVTYGGLTGVGQSLVFLPIQVTISRYFKKYLGVAMGCVTASYALSKLVMTPMIQLIIDTYGCRETLFIMGAFMLHVCVGGALCQPAQWHSRLVPKLCIQQQDPERQPEVASLCQVDGHWPISDAENGTEMGDHNGSLLGSSPDSVPSGTDCELDSSVITAKSRTPDSKSVLSKANCCSWVKRCKLLKSLDFTLLREGLFYLIGCQNSLLIASMVYGTMYIFPFGTETGLLPMEAAGLVSARSMGEIAGRLAGPTLVTLLKLPTRITYICIEVVHGVLLIVLTYMLTLTNLYCVGAIAGVVFGAAVGLSGVLIVETMGVKRLPSVLGLNAVLQGTVVLGIGPLIGWMRDVTGSYGYCLIMLGTFQFLIAILWLMKPVFRNKTVTQH